MKTYQPPPEKAAGRAEARPTNNETKYQEHASSQNGAGKTGFADRQSLAEENAKRLVAAVAEHGRAALHGMPPECLPSAPLADVMQRTLLAADAGARGFADVMAVSFATAPDHVRGMFVDCAQDCAFPASPAACKPTVDALHNFHRERRARVIADKLRQRIDAGEEIADLLAELRRIEAESTTVGIGDLLGPRAFDFENPPPRPIPRFLLADKPLCTAGNLTNIQAPPKAGKSAVVDAMLAAVMNDNRIGADTLSFTAENPHGHALIHFDTEQSRFDADALVRRAIRRASLTEPPHWFDSFAVADLGIRERREALRFVMEETGKAHGGIHAVMIDGIGDLCGDPNDSEEAFELVHELHALAIAHNCTIVTVLHENPGSESGKTRGHLGSQLERKAETNLRLSKDKDGVVTLFAEKARHCYLPKDQGPCFSWNDEQKMHTSCGTAGEIRQAANREKMESEADAAFGGADSASYSGLVAAIMDALDVSERTAKSRVKTWLAEGITRKDSTGRHHLVTA